MKKLLFFAFVVAGLPVLAQSYKPELKLTTGKKYTVSMTSSINMSMEAMGQAMEIPISTGGTQTLEVKNANAEKYDLSSTLTQTTFSSNMMGRDVNYDSNNPEDKDSEMSKAFGSMLNKPTTFSVSSLGKVIDGSVVKPETERVDAGGNPFLSMMDISDANSVSPAVIFFNNGNEIKIGDSFTDSSTSADGKTKKNIVFTLSEIKDGLAKFNVKGTGTISKKIENQGMEFNISSTTKTTGELFINIATGLMAKQTLSSEISGNSEVMGMAIPITGNSQISITVTEAVK